MKMTQMINKILFCFAFIAVFPHILPAQKISYSQPEKDDVRSSDFDIIGKIGGKYLVYKNTRNNYFVSVYDDDMKLIDKVKLDFMPEKLINSDIITYKDYFYFIYQYQHKNIIYCEAARINGDGKTEGDPVILDTTSINFFANNKIYNVLYSEDKQYIGLYKINSKNESSYIFTRCLFDASLKLVAKNATAIHMQPNYDFLTEFSLNNDGWIAFVKDSGSAAKNDNGNIQQLTLMITRPAIDSVESYPINTPKIYFNDIRVKVDNINKHVVIAAFYAKQKRGNIEGLYCSLWSGTVDSIISAKQFFFNDELRSNAKSEGSTRSAFNDFFLQNIVARKDGGFVVVSESAYSTNRGVYNDRWNYPYSNSYWNNSNSYMYGSPYGYTSYPWMSPYNYGFPNQLTRYYADNIAILSFDSLVNIQWANIIAKSQFDDNSDNFIGYGTFITSGQVNFLFNQFVKRTLLLQAEAITPQGKIVEAPTLKGLDRGYQFMPRYIKQVSAREVLVPCQYRNYLCFAKIEF